MLVPIAFKVQIFKLKIGKRLARPLITVKNSLPRPYSAENFCDDFYYKSHKNFLGT